MSDVILDWKPANTLKESIRVTENDLTHKLDQKRSWERSIETYEHKLAILATHKPHNIAKMIAKYGELIRAVTGAHPHNFRPETLLTIKTQTQAQLSECHTTYTRIISTIDTLTKKLNTLKAEDAKPKTSHIITRDTLRELEQTYGIRKLALSTSNDKTALNGLEFTVDNPFFTLDWSWAHAPVAKGRFHVPYSIRVNLTGQQLYLRLEAGEEQKYYKQLDHAEWGANAHPHVMINTSGRVCIGTFDKVFKDAYLAHSVEALISICLQYIHTTNAAGGGDYGGMHAHLWLQTAMPEGIEETQLHDGDVKVFGIKGYYKDADGMVKVNENITYKFTKPVGKPLPDDAPVDPYTLISANALHWKK